MRTIAIDLTPVLPGGENGGAKVFVLELIRRLSERAPQTQFVLLTQAAAHEELASLDRPNVRRIMVLDLANPPPLRSAAKSLSSLLLRLLPVRPRRIAQRVINRLKPMLRPDRAPAIIRELKTDILFCPFTAPTYFEMTVPTVSTIYDLQYKTYPEFFPPADVAQRDRTFVDAARRSTMLLAISEYSRQTAIKHGNLDPNHIRTVHLHISQHSLRNAARDETILDRLQLTRGRYLIYPANFWKHKNHEMLLTALGIARSNGLDADIRLVCTGAPGARQQWLKQAAESMGLGARVLFPGYLSNAELLALITGSAGVVFPSLYEGFGLPVIEAMAVGVPVACSNVTSLPEVAGDAAILFNPRIPEDIARAITTLAQDKALTAQLIQRGDERAAKFSDSHLMAEQYWAAFQDAAGLGLSSNLVAGVHPDGWLGPNLGIWAASAEHARTVVLEVSLPGWVPIPKLTLRIRQDGKATPNVTISRGEVKTLSLPVTKRGSVIDIDFAPGFVPALTGAGDDKRELTAILNKCEIVGRGMQTVTLFPESVSA
ncbi:MAG: glycosyltransferase family 1 protein [Hyphomicrobiales bacterium]|nr:glycosyltransferase family 1 protein [Hyphomicrobiales bacterium]